MRLGTAYREPPLAARCGRDNADFGFCSRCLCQQGGSTRGAERGNHRATKPQHRCQTLSSDAARTDAVPSASANLSACNHPAAKIARAIAGTRPTDWRPAHRRHGRPRREIGKRHSRNPSAPIAVTPRGDGCKPDQRDVAFGLGYVRMIEDCRAITQQSGLSRHRQKRQPSSHPMIVTQVLTSIHSCDGARDPVRSRAAPGGDSGQV